MISIMRHHSSLCEQTDLHAFMVGGWVVVGGWWLVVGGWWLGGRWWLVVGGEAAAEQLTAGVKS